MYSGTTHCGHPVLKYGHIFFSPIVTILYKLPLIKGTSEIRTVMWVPMVSTVKGFHYNIICLYYIHCTYNDNCVSILYSDVICKCRTGYAGTRCYFNELTSCPTGYRRLADSCVPCSCHLGGVTVEVCSSVTGKCDCDVSKLILI